MLISLFSSVFKSAVGMLLIPTGEGGLYACHRTLSNYFFMFFFRAHPLRVCTRLLLQMMRLPAASDYMGIRTPSTEL